MENVYIFDSVRTPRGKGKRRGGLAHVHPQNLAGELLKSLEKRNQLRPEKVEDVILGCVSQVNEQSSCIARFSVLAAGWPDSVPGYTVNRFCGSGLQAVNNAMTSVASGMQELVVAGGVESMSRVKIGSDAGDLDFSMGNPILAEQFNLVPQGISADLLATRENISRSEVDEFAAASQEKAHRAIQAGKFAKSIVAISDGNGGMVSQDEHPRLESNLQFLSALPASFKGIGEQKLDAVALKSYPGLKKIEHVHTLGNSSGIVDGAALLLLGGEEAARQNGLKPRARVVSMAATGSEPTIMLTGPVSAAQRALQKAGLQAGDIDLWEINEAFAAVVLYTQRQLGVPPEKMNVNGGAIALGHPLGGTGAILLGTALDELEQRKARYALATLCIGGGMGIATVIERL